MFFLYVQKYHTHIKCLWITKNYNLYKKLKDEGLPVNYAYNLDGIINNAIAKYIFVTHGAHDVNEYLTRNAVIIDFFHATCPIKIVGYASGLEPFKPESFIRKLYFYLTSFHVYVKPSYAITSSNFTAEITRSNFEIDEKNVLRLGLPETDLLLNKTKEINKKTDFLIKDIVKNLDYDNIILFLPTWRSNPDFNLFHYDFNSVDLENMLKNTKSVLLIKLHPFDEKNANNMLLYENKRLIILDLLGDEINLLLRMASIFITDYSSLWADYLIFNRPMIFAQYDHEKYLSERAIYDYEKDLPGYKVKNWPELIDKVQSIIIDGNDSFEEKRLDMKKKIYDYADGKSCERIYNFVNELQ